MQCKPCYLADIDTSTSETGACPEPAWKPPTWQLWYPISIKVLSLWLAIFVVEMRFEFILPTQGQGPGLGSARLSWNCNACLFLDLTSSIRGYHLSYRRSGNEFEYTSDDSLQLQVYLSSLCFGAVRVLWSTLSLPLVNTTLSTVTHCQVCFPLLTSLMPYKVIYTRQYFPIPRSLSPWASSMTHGWLNRTFPEVVEIRQPSRLCTLYYK